MIKVFFISLVFSFTAKAMILTDCGVYRLVGTIVKNKKEIGYSFILNKGTKSEYTFKIELEDELKISPFLNHEVALSGLVDRLKNQTGHFNNISKAERALIDHFNLKSNYTLIKKVNCLK